MTEHKKKKSMPEPQEEEEGDILGQLSKLFKDRVVVGADEAVVLSDALSVLNQVSDKEDSGGDADKQDKELGELEFINMNLCHSLSTNHSDKFHENVDKVKEMLQDRSSNLNNSELREARHLLKSFTSLPYEKMYKYPQAKELSLVFNRALACAIKSNISTAAQDILIFCSKHFLALVVTVKEVKSLLANRDYETIRLLTKPEKGSFMLEAAEEWLAYSSTELKGYKPPLRQRINGAAKSKKEPVEGPGIQNAEDNDHLETDRSAAHTGTDEDKSAAGRTGSSFYGSDQLPSRTQPT